MARKTEKGGKFRNVVIKYGKLYKIVQKTCIL